MTTEVYAVAAYPDVTAWPSGKEVLLEVRTGAGSLRLTITPQTAKAIAAVLGSAAERPEVGITWDWARGAPREVR